MYVTKPKLVHKEKIIVYNGLYQLIIRIFFELRKILYKLEKDLSIQNVLKFSHFKIKVLNGILRLAHNQSKLF